MSNRFLPFLILASFLLLSGLLLSFALMSLNRQSPDAARDAYSTPVNLEAITPVLSLPVFSPTTAATDIPPTATLDVKL